MPTTVAFHFEEIKPINPANYARMTVLNATKSRYYFVSDFVEVGHSSQQISS